MSYRAQSARLFPSPFSHLVPDIAVALSSRSKDILAHYAGEPPGVLTNLARMLEHGRLKGTGKLVLLPVDQGIEHGPIRSFAGEPDGMDPLRHARLAVDAEVNAHAAPLGAIERVSGHMPGAVPLILKLNGAETLSARPDAAQTPMATVKDALRLGCVAVGFTLYPGSAASHEAYQWARDVICEARSVGLPSIIWAYPRGSGLSKAGETALDVVAYAAHLACQLGAHIVKVKPPSAHVEQPENKKMLEKLHLSLPRLRDRVAYIKQCAFAGTRLVVFSGGPAKAREEILSDIREVAAGGADGCIVGRNSFQRPLPEGRALLQDIMALMESNGA